ncbi:CPBP family intramembrane metalloprotease [Cytobacillus spongiae]|jgi:membrane protease YdiL (CAAX protease family)|uniref:CPBP family intramembrane glutamic endopeptidase n=1 Tax=Cytobacillus spongiae TaxID=2901381 RepID=UPI001F4254CD|nr:type II CAAX endopeptidase family protein [Cytobacillus spongiae]UII54674.1 CPBP family intramembrane metalloprotease [Cytobacillus spongiae]
MKNKYEQVIKEISDRELFFHLFATQILLLTIAFILGIILFNSYSAFFDLFLWEDWRILSIGGLAGLAVVFLDLWLMKWLPKALYDDGGLNEKLFQNKTVIQIALIAAMVAISEEILFRGVIQTHFGLVLSSVIFALVHYRYLFNWFLFINVTALSFLIGYIYFLTNNLLVTIFMHFVIDFLLGVMIRMKQGKPAN